MSQSIEEQIEPLIDSIGLYDVLGAIANICHDKADELAGTLELITADRWRRHAKQINLLAEYLAEY